jgi:hypothetical protein
MIEQPITKQTPTPEQPMIETIVRRPITNPATGAKSRTFEFAGKIDVVDVDKYGRCCIRDWKTCSNAQQTKRQKMLSFQSDLYACAIEDGGIKVDYADFCLIERPTIKLCSKDFKPGTKDLDPEAYEERCMEWLSQEGKLDGFRIPFTPDRRLSARQWIWDISQQILEARRNQRYLPNESACYCYQRECPYMNLCFAKVQGFDVNAVVSEEYQIANLHPELEGLETADNVLSYSSASTFCLCQAKYFWRYEAALKPKQVEESEALTNGINVHRGLEIALTQNLEAGLEAVSPGVLSIDTKSQQDKAKARAMVRAAFEKWGMGKIEGVF